MSIRIERAVLEDGKALMQMGTKAFENDILINSSLPQPMTPEQRDEHIEWRRETFVKRFSKSNRHYFKAIDEATGEIVGMCGWNGPVPEAEDEGPRWENQPKFVDLAVHEALMADFLRAKKETGFADRTDFWYLQSCAVHPAHRGRGIADKLMQLSLRQLVDRDGREAYLEASPMGKSLYLRCGFEERMRLPQMDGKYVLAIMVRPAQPKANGVHGNGVS